LSKTQKIILYYLRLHLKEWIYYHWW